MRYRIFPQCALLVALTACGGGGGDTEVTVGTVPGDPAPTPQIAVEPAFTGLSFSQPLAMLQPPGDGSRWFVAEKGGVVRSFANDASATASSVFLDIRGVVDDAGEGGLLGLAFHPDYPDTPDVYVSYTRSSSPLVSYVSKFTSSDGGTTLNAGTEQVLFTVEQFSTNHNGGHLTFGPDGLLYVGFGDGGGSGDPQGNGQNTATIPGSLVRIDVDTGSPFSMPPGNPFQGNAACTSGMGGAPCPEIYAWGFRNPWRFSFDRSTGRLWLGDVGQGSWEEIDIVEVGQNYGWNVREGAHCHEPPTGCAATFSDPVTEYARGDGGSVTGGYVYRGSRIADLVGWYVFGDFVTGRVYAIAEDSTPGTVPQELLDTDLSIASFGQSQDGELYVVDYSGSLHIVTGGP